MRYVAIIGTSISITVAIVLEPSITNFSSVYYLLILTLIYMDLPLTVYSIIYGLGIMIYMSFYQDIGVTNEMLMPYFLYYILIAILMFAFLRVSNFMIRTIEEANEKSEQLIKEQEAQQDALLRLVNSVTEKTALITSNTEDNNRFFQEMGDSFQEIATGSLTQSESTQAINEAIGDIQEQFNGMKKRCKT